MALYIIHRWDDNTPIEETMEALYDVVRCGKARDLGASAMWTWQFQKALHVAERHGWTRFVSMQDHLNLLYREEEREMLPLCRAERIAVTPSSPLASGRLARDRASEHTRRSAQDQGARSKYDATIETDQQVVARVAEVAGQHGVSRVHIALAWLLQKEPLTAPSVGSTRIAHLEDAIGAMSVKLSREDVAYLEESDVPHPVVGHAWSSGPGDDGLTGRHAAGAIACWIPGRHCRPASAGLLIRPGEPHHGDPAGRSSGMPRPVGAPPPDSSLPRRVRQLGRAVALMPAITAAIPCSSRCSGSMALAARNKSASAG